MATIKTYTDIEQSKKLTEILPLENADMIYLYWINSRTKKEGIDDIPTIRGELPIQKGDIPCWSLAALFDVIPGGQVNRMAYSDKYEVSSWYNSDFEPAYYVEGCDNAIDACYELILKLHKNNIL